jgi:hypothetical protein
VEPETLLYSADCQAKQLCQENTSVELNLIVATIEEIVQSLIRELTKEKRRNDAAMSGGENLSKDSVNVASVDMRIDQSTSSRASSKFKPPPAAQWARPPACGSGNRPDARVHRRCSGSTAPGNRGARRKANQELQAQLDIGHGTDEGSRHPDRAVSEMGPQSHGGIHVGRGLIHIGAAQERQRDSDATGSKNTNSVG